MKTKYMYLTLLLAAFGFNAVIFSAAAPVIEETSFNGPQFKQTLIARGVPAHVSQDIVQQLNNLHAYPVTVSDIDMTYGPTPAFNFEQRLRSTWTNIDRIIELNNIDDDLERFIYSTYDRIRRNKNFAVLNLMEQARQDALDEAQKRAP